MRCSSKTNFIDRTTQESKDSYEIVRTNFSQRTLFSLSFYPSLSVCKRWFVHAEGQMHSSKSIVRCISDINVRICCKRDISRRETNVYLTHIARQRSQEARMRIHISGIFSIPSGEMKRNFIYVSHSSFVRISKLLD